MFSVYLKDSFHMHIESLKTNNSSDAMAFFDELVCRESLQGVAGLSAVFSQDRRRIAVHKFDALETDRKHFWRNRVYSFQAENLPRAPDVIDAEPGRPCKENKGKNRAVYLTDDEQEFLKNFGGGNLTVGVRKAMELAKNAARVAPQAG